MRLAIGFNCKNFSMGANPNEITAFLKKGEALLDDYLKEIITETQYLKLLAKHFLSTRDKILNFNVVYPQSILMMNQQLSTIKLFLLNSFAKITSNRHIEKSPYSINVGGSVARDEVTPFSDIDHMVIARQQKVALAVDETLNLIFDRFKESLEKDKELITMDTHFRKIVITENLDFYIFDMLGNKEFTLTETLPPSRMYFYRSATLDFKHVYGEQPLINEIKKNHDRFSNMTNAEYLAWLQTGFNQKHNDLKPGLVSTDPLLLINIKDAIRLFQFFIYFTKTISDGNNLEFPLPYVKWIQVLKSNNIITEPEARDFTYHFEFLLAARSIVENKFKEKARTLTPEIYKELTKKFKMSASQIVIEFKRAIDFIIRIDGKYREKFLESPYI